MISQNDLFEHLAKVGVLRKSKTSIPSIRNVSPGQPGVLPPAPVDSSMSTAMPGVLPLNSFRINPASRLYKPNNLVQHQRRLDYRFLRRVAEKAWLINAIIGHQTNKVRPFLSVSPNDNERGFKLALIDGQRRPSAEEKATIQKMERWIQRTGEPDPYREDTLVEWGTKFIRDAYTLDQISTEIQLRNNGTPFAFWAVDPATILRADESGYMGNDAIRYVQEIDTIVRASYTAEQMVFGYQNARSDVEFFGYGYSKVEQAVELILAFINAFAYNAGSFTDDRLPRGMLLLQGDADTGEVEMMEDYIVSLMQGGPAAKWRIPIIPSGGNGAERKVEWVSFQNSNRDMEYSEWTEATWSSVAALFDTGLDEMGINTKKSGSVLGDNVAGKIELSKSRGLMANLSFMKSHLDKIIQRVDDRFCLKWCGLEPEDIKARNEARESELRTYKSIDQIRAEADDKPFNEEWSKIPLNPFVIQMVQAAKQAQMTAPGPDQAPGQPPGQPSATPEDYRKLMDGSDDAGGDEEPDGGGDEEQGDNEDEGSQTPDEGPKPGSLWDNFKKSIQPVVELYV